MTAIPQPEPKSPSRRALLAGALGGIGALAATVIGRADPVRANDPNDVVLGGHNLSTLTTSITNSSTSNTVMYVENSTNGTAIFAVGAAGSGVGAFSSSGRGLYGSSTSNVGTGGNSSTNSGVFGYSGAADPPAAKAKTGVYGYAAQDNFSRGVIGESPAGIGVYGISSTGYGGYFGGRVYTTQFYELGEVATPAAPLANRARLFVRDNGAGKTQLCVRFRTGAVQVIKTEP